jgi:hypothetical protein
MYYAILMLLKQYSWSSAHVLAPFVLGIVSIIAFIVWEAKFAPYPMVPARLFSKDQQTMIAILLLPFGVAATTSCFSSSGQLSATTSTVCWLFFLLQRRGN